MDKREKPKVLDIDYVEAMSPEPVKQDDGVENFRKWFREMKK